MKNIAICIYGLEDENWPVEKIQPKDCTFTIFTDVNKDKYNSLFRVSFKKRDFEITNDFEFYICIAIYARTFISLDELLIPEVILDNKIYSSRGHFLHSNWRTGISMNMFLCKSIEFDRAAEYVHNIKNIPSGQSNNSCNFTDEEEMFYFHLKSLFFNTECVNVEDSSMFIRTA